MKHPKHLAFSSGPKGAVAALAVLAAACHHGGSDHVIFVTEPILATELEPNEVVEDANFLGFVRPGREFLIDGFVADAGPDQVDHFAFEVGEPVEVEFYLDALVGNGDLDVCIYDPVLDEYVFCFENPGNEHGFFSAPFVGEEFQIAVYSFEGSAEYELDVILHTYVHHLEAAASDAEAPARRSVVASPRNASQAETAPRERAPDA